MDWRGPCWPIASLRDGTGRRGTERGRAEPSAEPRKARQDVLGPNATGERGGIGADACRAVGAGQPLVSGRWLNLTEETVADGDDHEENGGDGEQFSGMEFLERDEIFHGGKSLCSDVEGYNSEERRGRYIQAHDVPPSGGMEPPRVEALIEY